MNQSIKYLLLTPFAPLKYLREFEESGADQKVGRQAFIYGISLAILFAVINFYYKVDGLFFGIFILSFIMNKTVPYIFLGITMVIFTGILGNAMKDMKFGISIIGLSMLPPALNSFFYMILPSLGFDIYWITIIWQGVILTLALNVLGHFSMVRASIITGAGLAVMVLFQIYVFGPFTTMLYNG